MTFFPDAPMDLGVEVAVESIDDLLKKAEVEWERRERMSPPFCDYEVLFDALANADLRFHREDVYWLDVVRWMEYKSERSE